MTGIRSQAEKHNTPSQGSGELRDTVMQNLEDAEDSSEEDGFPKFERIGVAELTPAETGGLTAFLMSCLEAPFFEIEIL